MAPIQNTEVALAKLGMSPALNVFSLKDRDTAQVTSIDSVVTGVPAAICKRTGKHKACFLVYIK